MMNEEAKRRIAECLEKQYKALDLSSCKLNAIPKEIKGMIWLESLNLRNNLIQNIQGFDKLVNLQRVNLSGNQIQNIQGLDNLVNLQRLYLHFNQIQNIQGLNKLLNLQVLDLKNNQIQNIQGLDNLVNLQQLNLTDNYIQSIQGLDKLLNLHLLILNSNSIQNIQGLDRLLNLQALDLSNNQIQNIQGLDKLVNLQLLHLNNNQIQNIELSNWSFIPIIDLHENPLKKLNQIVDVVKDGLSIQLEDITSKDKSQLSADEKEQFIKIGSFHLKKGIYIQNCHQLKYPPAEWAQLGTEVLQSYCKAITEQGEEEINEVKVILLGDGGAGKTSLAYRLAHPDKPLPSSKQRTRGVDVFNWDFEHQGKKYRANIWDFGGQTIYEAVHQYFFSNRALYIYVEGTRSGSHQVDDSRRDWFMQSAELFGGGSPMFFVQNQFKGFSRTVAYDTLREHYPFLEETKYTTNLETKHKLSPLIRAIKEQIVEMDSVGLVFPKKWLAVREAVALLEKEKGHEIISLDTFRNICIDQDITNEKAQAELAKYFHQLGFFLHYSDNQYIGLNEKIILNRNWATKATYQVYDDEKIKKRATPGRFDATDIKRLWNQAPYKAHKRDILELMEIFKICFKLEQTDQYVVPRLMNPMPIDRDYCSNEQGETPFYFYYEYDFMPQGIVNNLSVTKHDLIKGDQKEYVWSNGVVFEHPQRGLIAEVKEHRLGNSQRVDIRIIGKDVPYMADVLIDELDKINASLHQKRLKIEVKIPCICNKCKRDKEGREYYNYRQVRNWLFEPHPDQHRIQCRNSWDKVSMYKLVKEISHKGTAEVEEHQKAMQIAQSENPEIHIKGHAAFKLLKDQSEDIKTTVQTEHKQTRQRLQEETQRLQEQLAGIPEIFRKDLKDSEKRVLADILFQIEETQYSLDNAKELVAIVGKGIDQLFLHQMSQEDVQQAFLKMKMIEKQGEQMDMKEKLKISLPLLPFILKYEKELASPDLLKDIKLMWQEGGWKRLFIVEDGEK